MGDIPQLRGPRAGHTRGPAQAQEALRRNIPVRVLKILVPISAIKLGRVRISFIWSNVDSEFLPSGSSRGTLVESSYM